MEATRTKPFQNTIKNFKKNVENKKPKNSELIKKRRNKTIV